MPDVLYVGLQDADKILTFDIDAGTGKLAPKAKTPAAGTASGRLASYRINAETGALTALDIYTVGPRPAAVLAVSLGG
jgi:6-phosphogluconolactonase (cycloisomerase 2 family)